MHACYSHGVLPVCWACRMFNGSGISRGACKLARTIQVIYKKKSCNNNWQSKIELIITFNLPNKQQTAEISMENEVEGKGQISSSFSLL